MHFRYPRLSTLVLAAVAFLSAPGMADQAAAKPFQMAQAGSEFDFWSSIKNSQKAEDYRAYLDKYPNGNFADLAKLRMKKYAAAPAAAPTRAPAAVDPQQADIAYWNSIKASKSADAYRAYLEKFPNGEFVDVAKLRVAQLSAPAEPPAPPAPAPAKAAEPAATQSAAPEVATPAATPPRETTPPPGPSQPMTPPSASTQPAAPKPVTPARSMVFEAEDTTVYAKGGGQVRAKPDPKARLVTELETDAEVHATGLSADGRWWRVEVADGQVGYMHHSVVSDPLEQATAEAETWLPSTTLPATLLPTSTPPTLPATTPPATLPTSTQPTLPRTTPPASIEAAVEPPTAAAGSKESPAEPAAADEGVCPTTSQVAPDDRVAACERLVAKAGPERKAQIAALRDLAAALAQAQRYDEAIRGYKQAAALAPLDATIYYDIGLVRLDQLRFPEARSAFDKAAQLDPQNPDIVFQRGISYIGLGDFETARLEVKGALASRNDAAYYEKLGEIEIARGDLGSAKVALERGRKVDAGRRSLILAVVNYYVGDSGAAAAQVVARSEDPTAALWNAIVMKANGEAAVAAQQLEVGRSVYGDIWPGPIFDALSGTVDLAQARASVQAQDNDVERQRLCMLNLFAGEWAYLSGDKEGARAALEAAIATRAYYMLEFAAARARLANIDG